MMSRNSYLRRLRCQGTIVAILISIQAFIIMYAPILRPVNIENILWTSFLCLAASIAGVILIRNLGRYPGVEESSYIFVGITISYGLLLAILIMLRVPYSRPLIISTFLINIVFLHFLYMGLRRGACLKVGVVPAGKYREVIKIPNVEWWVIDQPEITIDGIDAISVDLWDDLPSHWERRLADFALQGIPVYDLKHLRESLTGKVQIDYLAENSLGTLSPLHAWMTIKHLLDWGAAFIALLLLWPFLAVVALAIKLDSPGPILFRQTRIGYRGKPFQVYKLRTMTIASSDAYPASSRDAAMTKDDDCRITRIGRFLRQSRIDELPQLINILKGEMSWIGPRPEAQVLSQWYESEIPFYQYRHIVRPGITGWAQVNQGHVADVANVTEKLHYDFYYIKHFSLWLDLIIVGRTLRTMMTGFGAR